MSKDEKESKIDWGMSRNIQFRESHGKYTSRPLPPPPATVQQTQKDEAGTARRNINPKK